MSRLASATIAMTASCVMLYFKLPDSIRSSVARSAHDYYVETKQTELGRHKSDKTLLKNKSPLKPKGKKGAFSVPVAAATATVAAATVCNGTPADASLSAPSSGLEKVDAEQGSRALTATQYPHCASSCSEELQVPRAGESPTAVGDLDAGADAAAHGGAPPRSPRTDSAAERQGVCEIVPAHC